MPDDELRNAVHAIVARLQRDFEAHLATIDERHRTAQEEIRRQTEAQTQSRVTEEWTAKLDAARQEWQARLQAELTHARTEADERLAAETSRVRSEIEHATGESTGRLRLEMEQALADATARIRAEMEQASELSTTRLRAELEEASAQSTTRLREQMEQTLLAERESARAQIEAERESARAQIEAERESARAQVDAERERGEANVQAEREGAKAELDTERERAKAEIEAANERAKAELESERARLSSEIETDRSKIRSLTAALNGAQAALAAAQQAPPAAEAEAGPRRDVKSDDAAIDARVEERQLQLALTEGLLSSVRAITDARSLTDTLTALAAAAASRAPRVALFIVNDRAGHHELQGWRAAGFGDPSPALLRLPGDDGGLLATTAASRKTLTTTTISAPPFAALPPTRAGLAVPITVGGKSVAVLYADDGGSREPEAPASWPEAVQILSAHASVCLSHITAVRTTQAMRASASGRGPAQPVSEEDGSARRYARLLVSEIKLYNETAVRTGREKRDLLHRLRPEIERARRLYEERVPASIAARATYFHEELVHTLADGDAELLGSSS